MGMTYSTEAPATTSTEAKRGPPEDGPKRVVVSGYFDPFHVGHLEYLEKAKAVGGEDAILVVIVNNDEQATLKKGKPFMPGKERVQIVQALKCVDEAVLAIDKDRTVCATIRSLEPVPHMFCNGGDQNNQSIPEAPVCEELGIKLVDGLGDKIQSSSWLIKGSKNIEKVDDKVAAVAK